MGRKTFESLGRVLPNRKHVVITKNKELKYENSMVEKIMDIKELQPYINSSEEHFVIGGAAIYKMLMPYAQKMYITKIEEEFEGDTYFPKINESEWQVETKEIRNKK